MKRTSTVYRIVLEKWSADARSQIEENEPDPRQDNVERLKMAVAFFCRRHPEIDPYEFVDFADAAGADGTPAEQAFPVELNLLSHLHAAIYGEEARS